MTPPALGVERGPTISEGAAVVPPPRLLEVELARLMTTQTSLAPRLLDSITTSSNPRWLELK